jgi:elongation factor G
VFVNKLRDGAIPKQFIPAIETGLKDALSGGVLAGYPAMDIEATLLDGSFSETDSSEIAFKVASLMAFKDASAKANPTVLEPIMGCEVVCPQEYMGSVIGDINARGGKIQGMNARGDFQVISAEVPLSRMFGYSTALRSSSQGRATFTMQFAHYSPVTADVLEEIKQKAGILAPRPIESMIQVEDET